MCVLYHGNECDVFGSGWWNSSTILRLRAEEDCHEINNCAQYEAVLNAAAIENLTKIFLERTHNRLNVSKEEESEKKRVSAKNEDVRSGQIHRKKHERTSSEKKKTFILLSCIQIFKCIFIVLHTRCEWDAFCVQQPNICTWKCERRKLKSEQQQKSTAEKVGTLAHKNCAALKVFGWIYAYILRQQDQASVFSCIYEAEYVLHIT